MSKDSGSIGLTLAKASELQELAVFEKSGAKDYKRETNDFSNTLLATVWIVGGSIGFVTRSTIASTGRIRHHAVAAIADRV